MPKRQIPKSIPTVLRILCRAREEWKRTANPADRALSADQFARFDDTVPGSFLNQLLQADQAVNIALAAQTELTHKLDRAAAQLALVVSHFHQVLDLGITRGTFQSGARSYYRRELQATRIPDLTTLVATLEAAGHVVTGEAARADAEGAGYVSMERPSAAEVGARLAPFKTLFSQSRQALEKTDTQRERLQAFLPAGRALAVDICDTVEFFYRKDPDDSSRRVKCERWGVVYIYDQPAAPTPPTP